MQREIIHPFIRTLIDILDISICMSLNDPRSILTITMRTDDLEMLLLTVSQLHDFG